MELPLGMADGGEVKRQGLFCFLSRAGRLASCRRGARSPSDNRGPDGPPGKSRGAPRRPRDHPKQMGMIQ
eukprot:241719-Pyramimonas_sp.AAC.1